MKPIKNYFGGLFILGICTVWFNSTHAQQTSFSSVNPGLESATDVQAMMETLETVAPVPFDSLPRNRFNNVSSSGFWSVQHLPGSKSPWPPLPGNFWGLDVWPLGDGVFILDDRNVDYVALQAAMEAAAALDSPSPLMRSSMMMSSLSSSYAYGNPVYLTNLVVSAAGYQPMTASFDLAGGTNFVPYDILMTTNLLNKVADWSWLSIGYTSNHYTFNGQPVSQAFFILAKPSKTMMVGIGNNDDSQSTVPFGLTNALQVAGGEGQSLALKSDGTVIAWGLNSSGEATVPTNLVGVSMIAAGWEFNVALLTNGAVRAWGGPNLFGERNVPSNLTNATIISAQAQHTLALRSDGTVVSWGYNSVWGETNVPVGLSNVTAIAAGFGHNLAVSNGFVVAWGYNGYGQCNVPTGLSNVVDVAAGLYHSLALFKNGTVTAWGGNDFGETNVPAGLSNVVAIAAGGDPYFGEYSAYSLALKSDGTVVAWGAGSIPNPVGGLKNVVAIGGGLDYALAVRTGPPTPVITLEPTDEYQVQGSNVTFTARGAGLYGVTYQWQTNSVNISGATNAALTLTNVQPPAQIASYRVVVGNEAGSIASSNASFYFITPPVINSLTLPTNQTVIYQSNLVLNVSAWAPGMTNVFPLSYQWQFNGTNFGANAASNTIHANASSGGIYSVLVSNAAGSTNAAWSVTVYSPTLLITRQPTNQFQIAGGTVTFAGTGISSNAVTYQWDFNSTNLLGATNALLTLTNVSAAQQGYYNFTVRDGIGTLASSNANFYLVTPPSIVSLSPPTNIVVLFQTNVSLSVNATAPWQTNGFPLRYQWLFNGSNIIYQTSSNYTFSAINSGVYTVGITNAAGATNASWSVKVLNPGNVWGWGENSSGQANVPQGVTNITALAAGGIHSMAVLENGTIVEWGNYLPDDFHSPVIPTPLGTPPTNSDIVAVAAGIAHDIALRADGTVIQWGLSGASGMANIPTNLTGVKAISAGVERSLALRTNGTIVDWGSFTPIFDLNIRVPADLTNATAISCGSYHNLALRSNGTVVSWGYNTSFGETNVPIGLSNVVAVAGGERHSLALKADGTVVAWGDNTYGQCNVPTGLSNVMEIVAGGFHNAAVKNDGTMISWGDNSEGQTNTPPLTQIKLIAAGGNHTIANIFSPQVMYPVDVSRDVLLIYNTNSAASAFIKDYYLINRPMVCGANVLGIGYTNSTSPGYYECISPTDITNLILNPVASWMTVNPTKRPLYVVLFLDVPSRVFDDTHLPINGNYPTYGTNPSVSVRIRTVNSNWLPFVTHINMNGTNDCVAYINKLASFGTNNLPRKLYISAGVRGYGNTNYYFDDTTYGGVSGFGLLAKQGVIQNGASTNSIAYINVTPDPFNGYSGHITNGVNIAGYVSSGSHSSLLGTFAIDGAVKWSGNSSWWLIETVESFNGLRYPSDQSSFLQWFSPNAFGGTDYSNTPIGAVSHVDEPYGSGISDSSMYFGLWESGKNFAICSWVSRRTPYFQAIGDPFVIK